MSKINTIEDIQNRLMAIAKLANPANCDDEEAHVAEDELWRDVLQAIADERIESPSQAARLALRSQDFEFTHWYA